jgi:hypothetical protein
MLLWKFSVYQSTSGKTEVQNEIDGYNTYDRQKFVRAVSHLSVSPIAQWNKPKARKLTGHDPLHEICYQANNRPTRALGYFQDGEKEFVIVLICYHKGKVYEPPEAFETAKRRIAEITSGTARAIPLTIDGEIFPANEE